MNSHCFFDSFQSLLVKLVIIKWDEKEHLKSQKGKRVGKNQSLRTGALLNPTILKKKDRGTQTGRNPLEKDFACKILKKA